MPFGSVLVRANRSNVSCLGAWIVTRIVALEQNVSVTGSTLVNMAFATEHPVLAHSEYRAVDDIVRVGVRFEVVSEHEPAGDQPAAIEELERRITAGERDIVLLGATGTGKSATTAWLIEPLQTAKPGIEPH